MSTSYHSVYGVALLDDLHNYFPSLLYEMHRFRTLPQVFQYVRQQMDRRFNLYSYGSNLFAQSVGFHDEPQVPVVEIPIQRAGGAPLDGLLGSVLLGYLRQPATTSLTEQLAQGAGFMSPVIIRPSAQVVQANTEIIQGSALTEQTVCSICQDTVSATDTARIIRACRHIYHLNCIDRWFERSVVCPTCRHDIRVPAADQTRTEVGADFADADAEAASSL
jgi:hypothetical protein